MSTPGGNGTGEIPTVLLDPTAVTKDNIKDTIIADDYWSVDEICTADYADACKELGLQ